MENSKTAGKSRSWLKPTTRKLLLYENYYNIYIYIFHSQSRHDPNTFTFSKINIYISQYSKTKIYIREKRQKHKLKVFSSATA
jgi:hypothetical protein